jgi:pyrroline-5-carboxylate reductase
MNTPADKLPQKVILVGCGKMGGALLKRAVSFYGAVSTPSIYVVDPARPQLDASPAVACVTSPDQIPADFKPDIVLFAVKPQQITATLPHYQRYVGGAVFLSIAAGVTLNDLAAALGSGCAIIRTMPNLPASIGQGVTALIANNRATAQQRTICETFMGYVGQTVWLTDEKLMNAVTAVSGSGPAYIFALCEAMAKAGETLGLPSATAMTLARQTIIGSASLLAVSAETPTALRQAVTSPGGTTEAALNVLLAPNGLHDIMQTALKAGADRGAELSTSKGDKK